MKHKSVKVGIARDNKKDNDDNVAAAATKGGPPLAMYMSSIMKSKCETDCKVTLITDHANQHEHAFALNQVSMKHKASKATDAIARDQNKNRQHHHDHSTTNPNIHQNRNHSDKNRKVRQGSAETETRTKTKNHRQSRRGSNPIGKLQSYESRRFSKNCANHILRQRSEQTTRMWDPFDFS